MLARKDSQAKRRGGIPSSPRHDSPLGGGEHQGAVLFSGPFDLHWHHLARLEMVDLKTAKALDFTIPRSVLVRADEVIQ